MVSAGFQILGTAVGIVGWIGAIITCTIPTQKAALALTVISIALGIMAILLAFAGGQCTRFVEDPTSKVKLSITSGVVFIVAGIFCLIPLYWAAHTIVQAFNNPLMTQSQKRELGSCLYIGWGASALMLIGGAMFCGNCPTMDDNPYTEKYSAGRSDY